MLVDETSHDAYDSYAIEEEEPSVTTDTGGEDHDGVAPRASSSGGLDVKPLLERTTKLVGENVSAQRDLSE